MFKGSRCPVNSSTLDGRRVICCWLLDTYVVRRQSITQLRCVISQHSRNLSFTLCLLSLLHDFSLTVQKSPSYLIAYEATLTLPPLPLGRAISLIKDWGCLPRQSWLIYNPCSTQGRRQLQSDKARGSSWLTRCNDVLWNVVAVKPVYKRELEGKIFWLLVDILGHISLPYFKLNASW